MCFWGKGWRGKGEGAGLTYSRQLVEFSLVVHRYDCFLEGWCFVRKVSGANKKVPFFSQQIYIYIYIYEALSLPSTLLDPSLHFIYFIYLPVFSVCLSIRSVESITVPGIHRAIHLTIVITYDRTQRRLGARGNGFF